MIFCTTMSEQLCDGAPVWTPLLTLRTRTTDVLHRSLCPHNVTQRRVSLAYMPPSALASTALWCVILLARNAACSDHRLTHGHRHQVAGLPSLRRRPDTNQTSPCTLVTAIDAPTSPVHVYHCPADLAYMFRTAGTTRPSLLVRVIGPHTIYTGLSRQLDTHTHTVSYSVRHTGLHHAFIRVLLEDKPRNNVTGSCLSRLPTVNHTFGVADNDVKHVAHTPPDGDDFCCWQTPATLTDRWTEFHDVSSNQATMRHRYTDLTLNNAHLLPDTTLATCIANATICLYGDSQMRNLRDSLTAFVAAHQLHNASFVYTLLRYPGNLTDALHATRSTPCTHSLFNFGQWPLGWVEYRPWSFGELEGALASFLKRVADLTGHVYWVSTPPFPITHPKVAACPPNDWRLLTHIDTFNEASKALVEKHASIRYIDTFRAMLHLHDFTFDGSHYQEPLSLDVARLVLSQLCEI